MKTFKKTAVLLLIVAVVATTAIVALAGCTGDYQIIHISSTGNALDASYNEATWKAVEAYSKDNNMTAATISPLGSETADYQRTIKKCVKNYNAKYIVCSSSTFRDVLTADFVKDYPNTTFIYFDDVEHNNPGFYTVDEIIQKKTLFKSEEKKVRVYFDDYAITLPDNVIKVRFDQYELGYAAGYTAAQLGKNIAFIGVTGSKPVVEQETHVDENGNTYAYALGKDGTTLINKDNAMKDYEAQITPAMQDYSAGFEAGVRAYAGTDTSYTIKSSINRTDDSDKGKRDIIENWVDNQGVDVIVGAAGNSYNSKLKDICIEKDVAFVNCDYDLTIGDEGELSDASVVRNYSAAIKVILENIAELKEHNDTVVLNSAAGVKALVNLEEKSAINTSNSNIIEWAKAEADK